MGNTSSPVNTGLYGIMHDKYGKSFLPSVTMVVELSNIGHEPGRTVSHNKINVAADTFLLM